MAMYLCCFRQLCGAAPHPTLPTRTTPTIILDTGYMGHEVVIVKNGVRICGTGGALGNIPILQNKAYFEVKLQQSGVWGVGIATRNTNLNKVPLGEDAQSWVLCSDGAVRHNGEEKYKIADIPQEGDILGVSYDHVELNFFINSKPTNTPVTSFKGTVYPALYVDDGAIMDVTFENFSYGPPPGYDSIMVEKSLLEND
ncbi:SPRY domain-containing protein 7-like [Eriocheir sinensis]|uniref:SPRY domain-containing protein 7-like n=1 Tax=Eriocheir sinensis TaxID=95602 RepID=UPI0021C6A420|nr:SPRY domain-containing protein 7-like [Eriocheir sinensis]XP_050729473.1 SPRY domain-containing protein 7-like [Eriocheir sinensis]XP_050729474.1 SPRY domain-containing protein 7-like [Eriocheir sinensis]XP_050729475.1 SPRY domain-containing protein 7-like [Eriocheir sinensis]XP_050729476.1 SPRY domain-containing protein 7-like [Eriocheir sinensis]XP_050729477.1 SPRY domain-containing protein 7-like [Eriocheir sinensis]XP_050729478.1 SPRY domain-containing protein 7-like [Eriocheir sinensi